MVKSYCVKQKKIDSMRRAFRLVKNMSKQKMDVLMMKCKCAECGITKTRFVKNQGN